MLLILNTFRNFFNAIYYPKTMKKTIYNRVVFLTVLLALGLCAHAQQQPRVFGRAIKQTPNETGLIRCVSAEYAETMRENGQLESSEGFETMIAQKIQERKARRQAMPQGTAEVITIPVVVHVIHNGDALGSNENITDAQVISQINVLNQDYRRMAGSPGFNSLAVGADVEINFCLAKTNPAGALTTGIEHLNKGQASWTESQIENTLKPTTYWNPDKYFNIWVCNFGGDLADVLGYAQFPNLSGLSGLPNNSGSASTDGVVIGYKYFGSQTLYPAGNYESPYNGGRTCTHEIGHALGLLHIWGDVNNCNNSTDHCDDTPVAYDANDNCPANLNSCPTKPGNDMTNNYMDYTRDSCMNIFTQDQKERMLAVMENSSRRSSLVTSTVCQAPMGIEDFMSLNGMNVYPNPAQDVLNISTESGDLPDSFVIYNSLGQTMANVKVGSTANLTVNTSAYSNGIYFIKIDKGSQSKTVKFIKN
jgi:Pregnancy-associated plasma protein-A/Secretion system C-terminal sorting domain